MIPTALILASLIVQPDVYWLWPPRAGGVGVCREACAWWIPLEKVKCVAAKAVPGGCAGPVFSAGEASTLAFLSINHDYKGIRWHESVYPRIGSWRARMVLAPPPIFRSGFESGGTGAWSRVEM